jgi:hypothetical protein
MSNKETKGHNMRYLKTKNAYTASNFYFDCDKQEGFSYHWWKFSTIYKGMLIFNNVMYSNSTLKHQMKAKTLLKENPSLILNFTKLSLHSIEDALKDEIRLIESKIADLETYNLKPRIRSKTIEKNKDLIKELLRKEKIIINLILA